MEWFVLKSQLDKLNEKIRKCRDSMFDTRLAATLSNSEEQRTQKLNEYKVIKKKFDEVNDWKK